MSTVAADPVVSPKASIEEVWSIATTLSKIDQEALANRLLDSLDDDVPSSDEWNREWAAALNRRIADIESGKVQLVSAEEADARIRRRLNLP